MIGVAQPGESAGTVKRLVMVIDDSLTIRKILDICLRHAGYQVQCFADGVEAFRWLSSQEAMIPGLVLVDLNLPKMDGYEIIRLLKANPAFAQTICIILSQRDGVLDKLKGRLACLSDQAVSHPGYRGGRADAPWKYSWVRNNEPASPEQACSSHPEQRGRSASRGRERAVIEQQELLRVQEVLEFQHVILEEIGELLPAPLLEECDLSGARSVLEIGCGGGEWLRSIARRYPDLRCIGIEQDESLVKAANALAYRDGLPHAAFLAVDLGDLTPALFPETSFDLVYLSFLGRYILTADYPRLAQTCAALCRPGGMVCWMEAELPVTTSAAFERLTALICEALQQAGQSFISESMWELAELVAAHSGKPGADRSSYQRRQLGITPMLGRWLRETGCGALREKSVFSPWGSDERVIHQAAYAMDVSAGQPAYEGFLGQVRRFTQRVKPFLLQNRVIQEREYVALCDRLQAELASREFCGQSFLLRAWAPRL